MDETESPDDHKSEKKGSKKMLSLERLRLATERLQLARIRTTLTLVALGFTAYKVFFTRAEAGLQPLLDFPNGRHMGIFLIALGFLSLLLATPQHLKSISKIKAMMEDMPYSLSSVLTYFILLLSLVLFVTVMFRL